MFFIDQPTRNLFFTGKGGVGKTSIACATAVQLADRGHRVLLISTDPASNLNEVLGVELGNHPTQLETLPNMWAMNLDPERSAAEYRERMVAPYRGVLPDAAVDSMEEQFSGSCTVEIAAFDEFAKLLGDPASTSNFDHLVFDTAPTGHTLRLLTLPSAWDGFMKDNTTGTSCLGPLAGLQTQQNLYQQTIEALSDPAATTLVLVTRAETSALREAARTSFELTAIGIENQHLVINGLFTASDPDDPYAAALEKRAKKALESVPEVLASRRQSKVPWQVNGTMGIDALRRLSESDMVSLVPTVPTTDACDSTIDLPSLGELIDEIADAGHGVVLAMGKGGVGKTTVAAAVALALAQRGHDVHLSTTDPAAHVAATVGDSSLPNLTVSRIDPIAETRKYSAQVMNNAGANLDEAGKALLAEDLRSPCTEEIAVFRAFADAVAQGADRIVVLDTAPTGHTVLLLDAALAYHREVTRQGSEMPAAVQQLLPRLRDPGFTRILIVTLPEATPVHEAAMLQRDLRRADIEPFAWVMNQVFTPLPVVDPILQQRKQCELKFIRDVRATHARRVVSIPWQIDSPRGKAGLEQLFLTNRPVANRPVAK